MEIVTANYVDINQAGGYSYIYDSLTWLPISCMSRTYTVSYTFYYSMYYCVFVISSQGIHAINCPHFSVLLHWRRVKYVCPDARAWWRHQMETFPAFLAICAGNSPVASEFPIQRPVTRSFDVFFDLRLNKQLSKQSCGWWFETSSRPLWRPHNE